MVDGVRLLAEGHELSVAIPPLRRRLLDLLHEPASAVELSRRTGISRQKINYHLRVLEQAGLVELVETRARRGCIERILRATSAELIVDPDLIGRSDRVRSTDQFAAEHLADTAAAVVRDVTRLRAGAGRAGHRLLTFTLETDIVFAQPADVHAFTAALAESIAELSDRFSGPGGRRYRVIVVGHPATTPAPEKGPAG